MWRLGARRRAPRGNLVTNNRIFLSESLIITLFGGSLEMGLGFLLPMLVRYFANMPTIITYKSLIMAFGISGAVGVIFGLYPAYRAARMDPIESLRHE